MLPSQDGAIHSAAGPSLYDECLTLNGCSTGSAKLTSGHGLPCKYIIHAVGPIYQRAKRESPSRPAELLTSCYRTSLELAAAKGGSIAFSCLSTGVYGYPSGEAAKAAIGEVRRWLEEEEAKGRQRLDRVVFCCFEAKDDRVYKEWLPYVTFLFSRFPTVSANILLTQQDIPTNRIRTLDRLKFRRDLRSSCLRIFRSKRTFRQRTSIQETQKRHGRSRQRVGGSREP